MKKLLVLTLLLTGCSFIMPVKHDPAEAAKLIDIKQQMETVSCIDKDKAQWQGLVDNLRWLDLYATFREDPQGPTVSELYVAIQKARDGSTAYCEATLKLNKTRVLVIEKAWKGRS